LIVFAHTPYVTRRDFVRGTVGTALGTSALATDRLGAPKRSSSVFLIRDEKVQDEKHTVNSQILKQMLDKILMTVTQKKNAKDAWLTLFKPTDRVGLVVTNHLNKTHVEIIQAVQTSLRDAGLPENQITIEQGGQAKPENCTGLICLPALKAHWLTGIGTVLKNYITFSGAPADYHDANNIKLGEIWNMPAVKGKTRLILVDALRPLCDKGPQPDPRYLWDYNGLIAGIDPVAVETVCLKIINEKRQILKGEPWPLQPPPLCIQAADETYHLGVSKWDEIRLEKLGWQQDCLV
jgi:hypothetical protein